MKRFFPFVASALALAAFSASLWNGLVWDDPIVLGQQLRYFGATRDVFFPPQGIPQFSSWFYRPLIVGSFLLDRALSGDAAYGYHLTVVLSHAAAAALLYLVLLRLLAGRGHAPPAALAGAVFFAVHPVHVDSVAAIAGRSDVLAFAFALGALLALASARDRASVGFGLLAGALYFLSLLSKEVALGLLPVVAVLLAGGEGGTSRETAAPRRAAPRLGRRTEPAAAHPPRAGRAGVITGVLTLATAVAAWLVLRAVALPAGRGIAEGIAPAGESMRRALGATGFYVAKCVLPLSSQAYYPEAPGNAFILLLGALAWGSLCLVPVLLRRGWRVLALDPAWFLGFTAPSLLIAASAVGRSRVAERYAYAPSAAVALAVSCLVAHALSRAESRGALSRARRVLLGVGGVVAVAGITACVAWSGAWRTPERFWQKLAQELPDYGLPQLQRGLLLYGKNEMSEARAAFQEALELRYDDAGRALARLNLGHIDFVAGDYAGAVSQYREAARLRPRFAPAHSWLGRGLLSLASRTGDPAGRARLVEEARSEATLALGIDPRDSEAVRLARDLHLAQPR